MFMFCSFFMLGLVIFWCLGYLSWLGSFSFIGYPWWYLNFEFLVDPISFVSSYMLMCCGVLALFYCNHYFGLSQEGSILFLLMCWFLLVMFFLILSSSLLFSLVMWEYLGLVSFFLILFYSNMVSLRASLVTLFVSRFGDVALFVLIAWCSLSWEDSVSILVLLLIVLTKSACYPFISWLIEAMRAPTPVSSLVHSSTLVAAGVWFLLRYSSFCDGDVLGVLLSFSMMTIVISGVCAIVFNDLKKIVALSTCNNVSWCIVFFICGDLSLALLQLLTHGVCKCYLFMSVGDVMSSSLGSQSSVFVYLSRYGGMFGIVLQFILVFSLCGIPFLGVFFGKHGLISEVLYSYGVGFIVVFFFSLFLSYAYSFRFFLLLVGDCVGSFSGYVSNFVVIFLMGVLGTVLNYVGGFIFLEVNCLGIYSSLFMLLIQIMGCFFGYLVWLGMFFSSVVVWSSSLCGSDFIVGFFYGCFSLVSSFFVLSLYRWELILLGFFSKNFLSNTIFLNSKVFSVHFAVFGTLFLVLFYVLVVAGLCWSGVVSILIFRIKGSVSWSIVLTC